MMRQRLWWSIPVMLGACDPDVAVGEPPTQFRGEALECVEPEAFEPYEDKQVKISSPSTLEPQGDGELTQIDETSVAVDKSAVYVCRCDSGCGGSTCEIRVDPIIATCTGTCDGVISGDGRPCWGCGWHQGPGEPTSPSDSPSGSVDPDGHGNPKPPGADPTAGSVDPTF